MQPLGGEYAGRRSALEQVPFAGAYGVEIGLLIDLLGAVGLSALAQVDLGVRRHTSQSQEALGAMAGQVVADRAGPRVPAGRRRWPPAGCSPSSGTTGPAFVPRSTAVALDERPPMATVPEYRARAAGLAG